MIDWLLITHFSPKEFLEPDAMSPKLSRMLEDTRRNYGRSMRITSSWRPRGDRRKKRKSAHQKSNKGQWEAVDIGIRSSRERYLLVKAALKAGFRRIGIYDRHIHLDVATEKQFAPDVLWIGKSQ